MIPAEETVGDTTVTRVGKLVVTIPAGSVVAMEDAVTPLGDVVTAVSGIDVSPVVAC